MYCEVDGTVRIEDEDQCSLCENFKKEVTCPLLQALALGYVHLENSLIVTNCGFFKEQKRHLKLVE